MRKNYFTNLLILVLSLCTANVLAMPYVEKEVEDFLSLNNIIQNQTLSVILTFNNSVHQKLYQQKGHAEIEKDLIFNHQKSLALIKNEGFASDNKKTFSLWITNSVIIDLSKEQILAMKKNKNIRSILLSDKKISLTNSQFSKSSSSNLARSTYTYGLQKIKIPEVRLKYPNLTGEGIRVGVLDSGFEPNHPDLKGKLLNFKNFSPSTSNEPRDDYNHGAHVSGTIVGGNASGTAIGIAPKAKIIMARIFDGNGKSTRADILKAMQWIADPDGNPTTDDYAQVVNNSWSDSDPYNKVDYKDEILCQVVDSWVSLGIIPVFSAGNQGPNDGTVGLPAGCPNAISVGATDINDRSPSFSSAGPAVWKNGSLIKPEFSAPGVDVFSSTPRNDYEELSGTSMSAPHLTGAFALILQAKPKISIDEAVKLLISGSKDLGTMGKDNTFGYGRIDLLNSLDLLYSSK
jgi:subtilisin family serine protease